MRQGRRCLNHDEMARPFILLTFALRGEKKEERNGN